jgi:hypothetical protein
LAFELELLCLFSLRYERIRNHFKHLYGQEPSFFGRAPGRVNLIGKYQLHLSISFSVLIAIIGPISLKFELDSFAFMLSDRKTIMIVYSLCIVFISSLFISH